MPRSDAWGESQFKKKKKNLKIFCKFQWKKTCVAGPQPSDFFKKRLQHKYFPVKFLRTRFSTEQLWWLLFKIRNSNNLFKDVSLISLTHNQSLMTCNSHNDKLI